MDASKDASKKVWPLVWPLPTVFIKNMQLISQVFSSVFGNPPTKSFPLCDLSASQIRDHIGLNLCNYGVMTKAEIEGTSPLTHEFPLPRYGAHFVPFARASFWVRSFLEKHSLSFSLQNPPFVNE